MNEFGDRDDFLGGLRDMTSKVEDKSMDELKDMTNADQKSDIKQDTSDDERDNTPSIDMKPKPKEEDEPII